MPFKTEEVLTEEQVQSGLSNVIKDGIASQAMGILTGGAFLIAFAIIRNFASKKERNKQ